MMGKRQAKVERFHVVLGLSAADMTYDAMAPFIGVGSRQRVQQLVVDAVATLPQLAERLGVTGRRHPGRQPGDGHAVDVRDTENTERRNAPRTAARVRQIATAKRLLDHNGGHFLRATEMLSCGHSALYQYMRKYPVDFECLIRERGTIVGRLRHKRRRRRRI